MTDTPREPGDRVTCPVCGLPVKLVGVQEILARHKALYPSRPFVDRWDWCNGSSATLTMLKNMQVRNV